MQQLERGGGDFAQHDALHDQQVCGIQLTVDRTARGEVTVRDPCRIGDRHGDGGGCAVFAVIVV